MIGQLGKFADVPFWTQLQRFGLSPALIDSSTGVILSYSDLHHAMTDVAAALHSADKKLVMLEASNDVATVIIYLGSLMAGHCVWICNAASMREDQINLYQPDILLWSDSKLEIPASLYSAQTSLFGKSHARARTMSSPIWPDLSLLLSTSGATGSPKLAKLSKANVSVAAGQVVSAMRIGKRDRVVTSLPLQFVYGLTVLNSHLAAGASVTITNRSVLDKAFWKAMDEYAVSSMAGVPWTLQAMQSIGFDASQHPSLKRLSTSGGRVSPSQIDWLVQLSEEHGVEISAMYGQTEAMGRIAVLPPDQFTAKRGSVGLPVSGGAVHAVENGEIVYSGPNVMLGYSYCRADLERGDELSGHLVTGDTGYFDDQGFLYITGRTGRWTKLLGIRLNLDDLEMILSNVCQTAITSDDRTLTIYLEEHNAAKKNAVQLRLQERINLPPYVISVKTIAALPRSGSGKVLYGALGSLG